MRCEKLGVESGERKVVSGEWIVVGLRGRMTVRVGVRVSVRVKQCAVLFESS